MANTEVVLTALTVVAGLSLVVERILEFLKHVMDSANGPLNPDEVKTMRARTSELSARASAALNPAARSGPSAAPGAPRASSAPPAPLIENVPDAMPTEQYPAPRIPLIPMQPPSPQDTAIALFLKFTAVGLGIILAGMFDLHLVQVLVGREVPAGLDTLFTGLVIGGASQPVHLLIRFISERKVDVLDKELGDDPRNEIEKTRALAKVVYSSNLVDEKKAVQPLQWIDVPYGGGVNPGRLQNRHIRSGEPELIVYHHTAMSSASTFQDVVNEFLVNKKWVTGYHCVIMPDGTIKPFCRWDRYGSHAGGLNNRSLGIAFHGNFHTKPGDRFSNADGRFGNQKPTEAQLHAGARVIVLWLELYNNIRLDFERSILPHSVAMPGHTDCPGSNFPHEELRSLIRRYHDAWLHSAEAQRGIAAFRQLQYV